ncbi:MAG: hypothetical protein ACI89L_000686 [Phycisphaerales bacterium]|jgi:hypothetical protein
MPGNDPELETMLKQARKKPRNFAAAMKGSDIALAVSKKAIKSAQIKELKAKVGASKCAVGICQGEGSTMVFRTTDALPDKAAKLLKALIKEEAGLSMKPVIKIVASYDVVDEDDDDPKEAARLKKLEKTTTGDFKALLKESGPAIVGSPETKKLASQVKKALADGDVEDAAKTLKELRKAIG